MAAEDAAPVGEAEADRLFAPLGSAGGVALAISGGADSIALMHLAAGWRQRRCPNLPLVVLTVDHGLRPESAGEARLVAGWAAELGLLQETLVWRGPKPRTGLQAAARAARYRLMAERCRALGPTHLVTAHHRDDQAETVLMRLSRGSGLDGLAGMAPETPLDGLVLARPLLDVPKFRLVATLRHRELSWIEDPSNADARFARARLRRLMPDLAAQGVTAERLAALAARLRRIRTAREAAADALYRGCVAPAPGSALRLDAGRLAAAPDEIGSRVLTRALKEVAGKAQPPRRERLARLHNAIRAHARGEPFRGATLAGCQIAPGRGGLLVSRERARKRADTGTAA